MKKVLLFCFVFISSVLLFSNESLNPTFENEIPIEVDFKTFNEIILTKLPNPEDKVLFLTSFLLNEARTTYKFILDISNESKKRIYDKLVEIGYIKKNDEKKSETLELKLFKKRGKRFYFDGYNITSKADYLNILKDVPKAQLLYLQSRTYLGLGIGFLIPGIVDTVISMILFSFSPYIFPFILFFVFNKLPSAL
ncbi:MAG TPA: hypothetical protein PK771_13095, partial [Spirochaetota bacterium]|nr:hypothetical protein [Spirochaetota bacterium]